MKKVIAAAMALVVSFATYAGSPKTETGKTYTIDTSKSIIRWVGKKVTGQHNGSLSFSNGTVEMNGKNVSSASFTTDMTSIKVLDLDGGYGDKLAGHLKSDDFFGVENHATAKFEMTSYKSTGADTGEMTGKLTIKGKTIDAVVIPVNITSNGNTVAMKGDFTFDRTKFDIKYGSASFFDDLKDKAIYNDVELSFALIATAK